jgi:hypothetical protein
MTTTVEHGEFERTVIRKGKKSEVKTKREKLYTVPNPAKFTICKGGDWEVFTYPYPNPDHVFLRVGHGKRCGIEMFEAVTAYREFAKISGRLKRYWLKMAKGGWRQTISGTKLSRAYDFGLQAFLESQSGNDSLIYNTTKRRKPTREESFEREYKRSRGLL